MSKLLKYGSHYMTFDVSLMSYNPNFPSGYVAYYGFENDGSDATGNYNFGSINADYSIGKIGYAVCFNGTQLFSECNEITQIFENRNPWGVSMWIKANSGGNTYQTPISFSIQWATLGYIGCEFTFLPDGSAYIRRYIYGGSSDVGNISGNFYDDTWHHWVFNYDGSTHTTYCDNSLVSTFDSSLNISYSTFESHETVLTIGYQIWIGGTYYNLFNGCIDQMRIYNKVIDEIERNILWNNGDGI